MKKYDQLFTESIQNPISFWKEQAQAISWFKSPSQVLARDANDLYRWYPDGQLNLCYLAIDQHIQNGLGEEIALYYDSPVTETKQVYTYQQLHESIARFAGGLQELGVEKGDRAIIYMPMIPEAVVAMLACVRIGCVHSVVFGGFAAHELAIRIEDARPTVLITASHGVEVKKIIPYKPLVDKAVAKSSHKVEKVIHFDRPGSPLSYIPAEYDVDFQDLLSANPVDCVSMMATDPLYILYTSGTTSTPKGIVRDSGGYAVALNFSMKYVYGVKPGETFWAASDIGWVVGHSYIVYGPLIYGAKTVLFEGKPIKTPDASTFWRVIQEYEVAVMFTAPTAIRAIRMQDPEGTFIDQYRSSTFRTQFLAGERCDVDTLRWAQEKLKIPVIDHWWQTESGWPMIANMMGLSDLPEVKPGSSSRPVCGYDIQVLDAQGKKCPPGQEGYICVRLPLPPGTLPNLWENTERFLSSYLERFPGYYLSGDGGYMDEDGFVFITGRIDDVINVAGHRLSTSEIEEIIAGHPDVAECACFGVKDELKGQKPLALIVCHHGREGRYSEIQLEVKSLVRSQVGAIASLRDALFVKRLPKTRSGKTLRKLLRQLADGEEYKVPSTIDNVSTIDEIKAVFQSALFA